MMRAIKVRSHITGLNLHTHQTVEPLLRCIENKLPLEFIIYSLYNKNLGRYSQVTEPIHKNGKEIRGLYIQLIGIILSGKGYLTY